MGEQLYGAVMPQTVPGGEEPSEPAELEPVQLGRDAILAAEDLPMERVDVPEWGGFVYVRTLTGAERDAFEDASIKGRGSNRQLTFKNIRARLVALSVCDEKGDRLFRDADAEQLGRKSAAALDRVFAVAQRLSRVTDEDVEDLAKNSEEAPCDS